jgi:hypothetical protein
MRLCSAIDTISGPSGSSAGLLHAWR